MMRRLTSGTFRRPDDMTDYSNPAVLYVQSYLLIRTIVGVVGIALPLIFIIGEAYVLRGGVRVRGSISAYYHTSMRDLFVAGLCVTAFLLATYMSGQTDTWDFWLSLLAGVALLGVVFFPTSRPGLAQAAPRCGTTPMPEGCSPIQQQFGEASVAVIHLSCAVVFVLSLAGISFLFGWRENRYKGRVGMRRFQYFCAGLIVASVAGVIVGELLNWTVWELTPLYLGEVTAVWAFGASWLMKGTDLRRTLFLWRH